MARTHNTSTLRRALVFAALLLMVVGTQAVATSGRPASASAARAAAAYNPGSPDSHARNAIYYMYDKFSVWDTVYNPNPDNLVDRHDVIVMAEKRLISWQEAASVLRWFYKLDTAAAGSKRDGLVSWNDSSRFLLWLSQYGIPVADADPQAGWRCTCPQALAPVDRDAIFVELWQSFGDFDTVYNPNPDGKVDTHDIYYATLYLGENYTSPERAARILLWFYELDVANPGSQFDEVMVYADVQAFLG